MSDLKNVLKAGLLVTASLFATGCGDNTDTAVDPNGGSSGGNTGGGTNGGTSTSVQSIVPTFTLDLGTTITALKAGGLAFGSLPAKPAAGYGKDYDVLANIVMAQNSAGAALSSGAIIAPPKAASMPSLLLQFTDFDQKGDTFKFDVSNGTNFKATAIHAGAMIFSGLIDTARHVFHATVKGDLRTNALILRNAVFQAFDDKPASISATYSYIGLDSAFGYPFARQDKDGKESVLDVKVHSEPAASASQLSSGTATASKATQTTKVTNVAANKASAKPAAVNAPVKSTTQGTLTLKTLKPDNSQKTMLNAAGLNVTDTQGTLDIGGRVAVVEAKDVVITAISGVQPELELPAGLPSDTVSKAKLSAGTAPKKSTSTPASVAASSKATVNKPTISQDLVKQAGGTHHFMFGVKAGGLYSEIGELKVVGAHTTFTAIANHALLVHTLNLTENLGVRVLAEAHTLEKLKESDLTSFDVNAVDKVAAGQSMMKLLAAEGHSTQTSDVVETATVDKVSSYVHYDSHTPFPFWVAAVTGTADKTLIFEGIDLDTGVKLEPGVYALPFVKDMSGKLPNSSGSDAIAIDGSSVIKEWKLMGNGYFDKVLLIQVAAKAAGLSSGVFNRALMSSKAQAGRSVASATLDAVVAKLDPTNLVSTSFAGLSSSRLNQASQIASLARGVNGASAEKLGAVEQYAVTFNHAGAQFGLTYNLDGGNAFSSDKGTTSFGANVASDVLGLKAIVSAEASVDAGKNAYAASSLASYNAGVTFAKAYNLGGLAVVPMGGFGVSSNALNSYSAVVPMAAGMLGLSMNDVSFTAATFHAGVNLALDDFVATATGASASLTLGVAGYLASTASATLSTSEGKSSDLSFGGDAVTPYAQFNLGFATGEKFNTMISSGIVAVNFGLDR